MSNDSPNINIGQVTGGQNNIGKTEIHGDQVQHNTYGDVSITFEQVMQSLAEAIPDEGERGIVEQDIIQPLREIADQQEPKTEQERLTLKDRIMSLTEMLKPYLPEVRKAIAAFGDGALGKLASGALPPPASWVVAGVIEICRDNR